MKKYLAVFVCLLFVAPVQSDNVRKSYYPSGALKIEADLTEDPRNGFMKSYYESGALKLEMIYKDGLIKGVSKGYYEDGQLMSEMISLDQDRQAAKEFYPTGELRAEINFQNMMLAGVYREYYKNGNLKIEKNYKVGELYGEMKIFYEDGALLSLLEYDQGRLIKSKQFDETGAEMDIDFPDNLTEALTDMAADISSELRAVILESDEDVACAHVPLKVWVSNKFLLWSE